MNKLEIVATLVPNEPMIQAASGSISETYIGRSSVLHLNKFIPLHTPSEVVVCDRWLYPEKGAKIQNVTNQLATGYQGITVPKVYSHGQMNFNDGLYQYWIEQRIHGESLSDRIDSGRSPDYDQLALFIAHMHDRINVGTSEKLIEYYQRRFKNIDIFLQSSFIAQAYLGMDGVSMAREHIDRCINTLQYAIPESEHVSFVHGDFRTENIIANNRYSIIDFEQGINGGDWLTDLYKLLRLDYTVNMTVEQRRLINLYMNHKDNLTANYLDDDEQFRDRLRVVQLDNHLSNFALQCVFTLHNVTRRPEALLKSSIRLKRHIT